MLWRVLLCRVSLRPQMRLSGHNRRRATYVYAADPELPAEGSGRPGQFQGESLSKTFRPRVCNLQHVARASFKSTKKQDERFKVAMISCWTLIIKE